MFDLCRHTTRLFCLALMVLACAVAIYAATPAMTTISDTIYRADGRPAGGTLLISWPAFNTADGIAVAAGTKSVTLGPQGALSVDLVPNVGATPGSTYYSVVFHLDDGTARTEYWVVPTTSPVSVATVRASLGTGTSASQMASRQYVDVALAGKANDSAVVHLSGDETITGIKQFSSPLSIPDPAQPNDAVNKEYVDGLVSNSGSGSYVSKNGDIMTGPLTLSGDPTSTNQATTRHYVDTGLSAKATLQGGLVQLNQLGNGTPDGTMCLKGDSSWGPCGTSSNAVSIQSIPVDTVAPSDNQVITYEAASGKYKPKQGGGITAGMQAIKYATDFVWSQLPATDLSVAGAKTITLAACGPGVKGSEPEYYVYIGGGTAESVKVTGGSCNGDGLSGTLQFTTVNPHSAGYTVGSASGGLQEALIAARMTPTNPTGSSQAGRVIAPPGEFHAYARVSIRSSNITVDLSGSILECYMVDTCLFVGDPSNSNTFSDITVVNARGRAMVVNGAKPFIEVNAQKTRLINVTTRVSATGAYFSSYVQVDDDQSFLLDGLDTGLGGSGSNYGVRCDATVCNPVIYAPGPFNTYSAVGWLKNLNISLQCRGNGIDWQSGNTLKVSDSVVQGFAQYGVRGGTRRGGYGGIELDNVYEEVGNCTNPAGNIGQAGVIAQGSTVKVRGGEAPGGIIPQFASTGSVDYRYYVVARHATYGPSNALYAGKALSSGAGNITVAVPDIAGAATLDLLRVTPVSGSREQAPYGTGNYAVVTGVSRASACTAGVCTFTDSQTALQSYTVPTPTYFPMIDYWPGNLVLGTNADSNSVLTAATATMDGVSNNVVAVQGMVAPAVTAGTCNALSGWTAAWMSCYTSMAPSTFYEQGSFLLAVKPNQDGGIKTNMKGRLNFATLGTAPGHIITLSDSNFQKTIATANNRPTNDINDSFIGYDQGDGNPANIGIALGAPKSLSNYIGNVGDGAECLITQSPALQFFPQYVPAANELIEVRYRGLARALARVTDPVSIGAHQRNDDDGIRGAVRDIQSPPPRTSGDCEQAALALLEDATGPAWSGDYETWSDFLPGGAADIFPGDAIDVSAPSRDAVFRAIVREVKIQLKDLSGDHSIYQIHFADDAAEPLAFAFQTGYISDISKVTVSALSEVGTVFLPNLTGAEITQVSSTTVTIDAGVDPPDGGGIEVRRIDLGWGEATDRNLVGRFATRSFTVPRLSRVQDYYIRQYGGSTPARYSRFSAALHLDYPL